MHSCGPYCTPEVSVHAWAINACPEDTQPEVIEAAYWFHADCEVLDAWPCEGYQASPDDIALNDRGERVSLDLARMQPHTPWLLLLWFPPWHPLLQEIRP